MPPSKLSVFYSFLGLLVWQNTLVVILFAYTFKRKMQISKWTKHL